MPPSTSWHLTPSTTQAFWQRLCAHFGTRVISKHDAVEMRACGRLFGALGILPYDRFMNRYTTVWARRIYPCFTPGVGDEAELWRQVVVGVHEHQHVVQYDRVGFGHFSWRYIVSSRERALLEAEAYGCNLELAWHRFGVLPDLGGLAARLNDYGCTQEDQAAAKRHYEAIAKKLKQGSYENEATRVALALMREVGMLKAR